MSPNVGYAPLASKEEESPSKAGLATENPPAEETGTIRPPPAPEPARVHRGWKYLALGFFALVLVGAACPPGPPRHHHHRGGPPCGGGGRGRHHRPDGPPDDHHRGHHHGPDGPDDHHHGHHHGRDGPDGPCPPPDRPHHKHGGGPDAPPRGPPGSGALGWLTAPPPADPDACRAAADAVPSECGDAFAALFDEMSRSDANADAADDVEGRVAAIVASCESAADAVAAACRPPPRFPTVARVAAAFGFGPGPEGAEGAEGPDGLDARFGLSDECREAALDARYRCHEAAEKVDRAERRGEMTAEDAELKRATGRATCEAERAAIVRDCVGGVGSDDATSEETAPAPDPECEAAKAAMKKPCEDDPAKAANDLAKGDISALEAARRIAKAAEECAAQTERVAEACEGPFNPPAAENLGEEDDEDDDEHHHRDEHDDEHHREHHHDDEHHREHHHDDEHHREHHHDDEHHREHHHDDEHHREHHHDDEHHREHRHDDEHHREHRHRRERRDEDDFERMDFEMANDACGSAVAEMKMECASAVMAAADAEGLDIPERAAAYARAAEECAEEAKDVVDACLD